MPQPASKRLLTEAAAAAQAGNAATPLGAALHATFVSTLGKSNGTDDSAWINAVIAGGGSFRGLSGQTYRAKIVLPSNTLLDMRGCTVKHPVGATDGNLATNMSAKTPAATGTGTTTVASAVVTTALAPSALVGQTLVVAGGIPNGPLVGKILSKTATTVTLDTAAQVAVSGAVATLFNWDRNIRIMGGVWDRGAVAGTGTGLHSLMFRHVDGLTVDIDEYYSTAGKYAVNVGNVLNARLGIGYNDSSSDGIHINGPARGAEVTRMGGSTGDDSVAITGNDYAAYADVAGDVIGVHVAPFTSSSKTANLFKVLAGSGCFVDRVTADSVSGSPTLMGVWIGDDSGQVATTGGTYGNVSIGYIDAVSTTGQQPLRLVTPNASTITARIRHTGTGSAVQVTGSSTAAIGQVRIDLDQTGTGRGFFIDTACTTQTIDSLIITGNSSITGAGQIVRVEASVITDLEMAGNFKGGGSNFAVQQVASATQSIKNLRLTGSFAGFKDVYRPSANAAAAVVSVSGRIKACERIATFYTGTNTLILAAPVLDGLTLDPAWASGGTLNVLGTLGLRVNSGTGYLANKPGGASTTYLRVNVPDAPADFTQLTPADGDVATNTNAAVLCGIGKAVYNAAAGKWKNLYTGAVS